MSELTTRLWPFVWMGVGAITFIYGATGLLAPDSLVALIGDDPTGLLGPLHGAAFAVAVMGALWVLFNSKIIPKRTYLVIVVNAIVVAVTLVLTHESYRALPLPAESAIDLVGKYFMLTAMLSTGMNMLFSGRDQFRQ